MRNSDDGASSTIYYRGPLNRAELVDIHLPAVFGFSSLYGYYRITGRDEAGFWRASWAPKSYTRIPWRHALQRPGTNPTNTPFSTNYWRISPRTTSTSPLGINPERPC